MLRLPNCEHSRFGKSSLDLYAFFRYNHHWLQDCAAFPDVAQFGERGDRRLWRSQGSRVSGRGL